MKRPKSRFKGPKYLIYVPFQIIFFPLNFTVLLQAGIRNIPSPADKW